MGLIEKVQGGSSRSEGHGEPTHDISARKPAVNRQYPAERAQTLIHMPNRKPSLRLLPSMRVTTSYPRVLSPILILEASLAGKECVRVIEMSKSRDLRRPDLLYKGHEKLELKFRRQNGRA